MDFPSDFYHYLNEHTLIEIKAGEKREKFTEIWMVVVNQRVFARSWNKSWKGWFWEILKTGIGELKYGDTIIKVSVHKIDKGDTIHEQINKAYLDKYNQAENVFYTDGITKPEYADFTLEFFNEPG